MFRKTVDLDAWHATARRHGLSDAPAWLTVTDYGTDFSASELKNLMYERFQFMPSNRYGKQECVELLMNADRADGKRWTGPFRFLNLPREMRNHIYRELLSMPKATDRNSASNSSTTHRSHAEVLAVSKQLHKEGEDILYGEYARELSIFCHGEFFRMPQFLEMSEHVFKFKKLSINLKLELGPLGGPGELMRDMIFGERCHALETCVRANHALFYTASQLACSPRLKSVEIHVTTGAISEADLAGVDIDDNMLQQMLWPIMRLAATQTVVISGVSDAVQEHMKMLAVRDAAIHRSTRRVVEVEELVTRSKRRMRMRGEGGSVEAIALEESMQRMAVFRPRSFVTADFVQRVSQVAQAAQALLQYLDQRVAGQSEQEAGASAAGAMSTLELGGHRGGKGRRALSWR